MADVERIGIDLRLEGNLAAMAVSVAFRAAERYTQDLYQDGRKRQQAGVEAGRCPMAI